MTPNGWSKKTVGEICRSIVPGRNKPKIFQGSIPWITTPEISGRYLPSNLQKNYIDEDTIKESGGKIVPKHAVVITAVGELGITAITTTNVVLNQQLHAFICPDFLSHEYLAYYLSTQKQYMESIASKTTIPYMNKTNCESIPVLYPTLNEQLKIAEILSTWDDAIASTEKLIANSEMQKKALMQQLLTGKKRLLDENGVRFSGEWESNELQKISTITKGKQLNKSILTKTGKYPVINGGIEPSGYSPNYNTDANTITISEGGNSCGFIGYQTTNFWCGGHCYYLSALKINKPFLFQALKFNESKIMTLRVGSGLPNIQKKAIESYSIDYPHQVNEQEKIAKVLSNADREIELLKAKLEHLKQEKKALMQQLLTGKRRVVIN